MSCTKMKPNTVEAKKELQKKKMPKVVGVKDLDLTSASTAKVRSLSEERFLAAMKKRPHKVQKGQIKTKKSNNYNTRQLPR